MTAENGTPKRMAANTEIVALKAAIDKLVESFTAFQVKVGENYGATTAELRHIQESVKALDGLFVRVSNLERDVAVLNIKDTTSNDDIKTLRASDATQNRMIYIGMGILIALQFLLGIFGPSLRGLWGLP